MKTLSLLLLLIAGSNEAFAEATVTHLCKNPNDEDNTQGTLELWIEGRAGVSYIRKGFPDVTLFNRNATVKDGLDVLLVETADHQLIVNLSTNKVSVFGKANDKLAGILTCNRPE